jgi:hypothetical protein
MSNRNLVFRIARWAPILLAAGCQHAETTAPVAPSPPTPPTLSQPSAGEIATVVRLVIPSGSPISADALKLSAGVHDARNNGALGAANLDSAVVQLLVAASTNGNPVMLGVSAGRVSSDVTLDASSTAEALVLLSPMLATADPNTSRQESALIRASVKFQALASLINTRVATSPSTWLAQEDDAISAAVKAVVVDVIPRLATNVELGRSLSLVPGLVGAASRNGITVSGKADPSGYFVTIENSRGRWLSVVAELSADNEVFGPPLDRSGLGAGLPILISSSHLINLILSKPNTVVNLGNSFSKARVKLFGPGFATGGPVPFNDPDVRYMYWPTTATVVFDVALPVLDMVIGIKELSVTIAGDGSGWPTQLIRLTGDCLTGTEGTFLEKITSPSVTEVFQARLGGPSFQSFLLPTLKCGFESAVKNKDVLLAILTSVGKASALASVISNISFVRLPFLVWGVVDLGKTVADVASSDALTEFDFVNSQSPQIFAASIGGSLQASSGPSDLYGVEVSSTGADRLVARLKTVSGTEPGITDLALTPNRRLWAVSFDRLYSVDTLTGIVTDIGSLGLVDLNALASDAGGNLWGATLLSQSIVRISSTTGAATIIGQFQGDFISNGDLAFAPDGRLFAALRTSTGSSLLATIDMGNGKATPVKANSSIGFDNVWGLTFVGNQLFGLTTDAIGQGTLITIDMTTGEGARLRSLSFNAGGAASRDAIEHSTPPSWRGLEKTLRH